MTNHDKVFPGISAGKESTCNAGNPGLIPGLVRSSGEELGYPTPILWASLMIQIVKNSPAMWETWLTSLDWEDPLEEGMATHSSILAWRIPMDRGAWRATVHGVAKSWTWLSKQACNHDEIIVLSKNYSSRRHLSVFTINRQTKKKIPLQCKPIMETWLT